MTQEPIRVLVVDDSGITRDILSQLIGAQADMVVVGAAATGHEAVRRASELQPDIVLMDIHMPDLDGIQATWLVSNKVPLGGVIMVTSEERIDFLQKAMSAGAQGYVLKPFGDGVSLLQTIRDTHARLLDRQLGTAPPSKVRLPHLPSHTAWANGSPCSAPKGASGGPSSRSRWPLHCASSRAHRSC